MNEEALLSALKGDAPEAGSDAGDTDADPAEEAFTAWKKDGDLESFRALLDVLLNED